MAGHEDARLGVIAMGERNTGIGCRAGCGCDARHHLERNALAGQRFDFFTATAEYEGVAPFQPQHALTFFRQPHEQFVDGFLRHDMLAALLTGIDAGCIAAHHVEYLRRHQAVIHDHIRLLHQAHRAKSQQFGVSRPRPHEINFSLCGVVRFAFQ